ncbi:YdcF family protein [uncultured Klebsiella sp.]|uniref:YdcF family protein n=1 Tax=uncultured Klebsiella sp. TaxID=284011 RepID=UPI0028044EAF|nr:YdcF family protein [uncultured Klebsiella sp.]
MSEYFPALPEATLMAANQLGAWLAQDDLPQEAQIEVVVLAGNAVIPTIDFACQLAARSAVPLLISGGIGHSTPFLYNAVLNDPRYCQLPVSGRAEACILADIAHRFWHIPLERIVVEDQSTHCGENARFTRYMLEQRGVAHGTGVVIQDPTMQRRTMATFARVWQGEEAAPRWYSAPGCSPILCNGESGLTFSGENKGLWPVGRYLSLILGELPRLTDDPQGYGPLGKGFIVHVDIPPHIVQAWQTLRDDSLLSDALSARQLG